METGRAGESKLRDLIANYLKEAKLMQLATSVNGQPWVCSVWFAADRNLNIYWFSSATRRHSEEVAENPKVAGAIALPQTPKDTPRGVQFQGIAELLTRKTDIAKAVLAYAGRVFTIDKIGDLIKNKNHHFYRIKPTKFVLFDAVNFPDSPRQELIL